VEFAG